jgi:hypothetical protein
MPVWQAVLLEAVTLATTNMIAGGPRLPPRGRDRTG